MQGNEIKNEINIENIKTHICKTIKNNNTELMSVVKSYNFFTKNEININNILHLLENKHKRYITIKSAKGLKIGEYNHNIDKLFLIKYNETPNQFIQGFTKFLYNKCEKDYIYSVIESYIYIMNSILKLQKEGIIYFNFSSLCVKFVNINNPHGVLYDFENSLLEKYITSNTKDEDEKKYLYFSYFIKKNQNFTFKSFELHVLFYLYHMDETHLSKFKITEIINKFVENMTHVFKEQDKQISINNCKQFMEQFINKNKFIIIDKLLSYYNTWDNYGVSILYLYLVENIIKGYKTQPRFMRKFQDILYLNVSQNPQNRLSINETILKFKDLFQFWV
jgi:hypothetical protein